MDKNLQTDIKKAIKDVRYKLYEQAENLAHGWSAWTQNNAFKTGYETGIDDTYAALDRIIARIPEPLLKENCVFTNCEFYNEDFDGHCNCEYCGGSAQEQCVWYVYLQKDRKIRKPKPAPDFDEIAQEIETGAFDCFSWNDDVKTFNCEKCAEILRKHFGKED